MKKYILSLALTGMLFSLCNAQTSVWKVEGNGHTIYLGGTVHLLKAEDHPLPEEFDEAYNKSDIITFEADLEKMKDQQLIAGYMSQAIFKGDSTLQSVLSDEIYKRLEVECSKINLPLVQMNKFKPFLMMMTFDLIKMQQMGYLPNKGVDSHYFLKAKTDEKKIDFLETVESQLEIIFSMDTGDENEFVAYSLNNFEKTMESFKDWRTGSSSLMIEVINEMKNKFPDFYNELLVKRNNNWLPKIDEYLNNEEVEFIMAGTMHFHGPDGIIKLLQDKGYAIEQL